MPAPAQVAEDHYAAQAGQAEAASILTRRVWRRMDPADLDASWARIVTRLALIVGSAQLGAARAGAAYVAAALAAVGADLEADGNVNPHRWAAAASDGRALDSLLFSAVIRVKARIGVGESPAEALEAGRKRLDLLVRTQVADADRGAAGVAIAARPKVGYVRFVSPPCCQRCAVLAGRTYRWNAGFARHPKCDCRHWPAAEGEIPNGYKSSIAPTEIKDLTEAQRKAIGDGADVNQVINSHRAGRRTKSGLYTSEGSILRKGKRRLTPEAIYRLSASRDEAIALLRQYGYLL